ncbi:DUF3426 domain-containing protein [Methylobacter sp.]|uniref:DUF3426 domain-containing protein n=1 Tax=Methylobacter sp. TaxID=2051955 RepID=UPI00248834F3|nr:DUF3426 domain-containing protein [Methylobacter sp.]MDI1277142.1 DUF3426 domain-containing protein [Methylobacter sp.]MDI1357675.1 DUF3426 domain-containing protein [Methylobacter sp.]
MTASSANPPRLPWDRESVPGSTYWGAGLIIALLLLAGQIVYFEGTALSRNPTFRPGLERICRQLNCQLPAYKNPGEFTVLQGSLSALPDHSRLFRAVTRNRAAFAQPYPNLELALLDYAENPFARRVFRAQDYLLKTQAATSVMSPDAAAAISLNIAAPKTNVGGYTFKLID